MPDKDTLAQLIGILKEIRDDARTVAALKAQQKMLTYAMLGIYSAFWGYILFYHVVVK